MLAHMTLGIACSQIHHEKKIPKLVVPYKLASGVGIKIVVVVAVGNIGVWWTCDQKKDKIKLTAADMSILEAYIVIW